jgi:hypothetical protein
MKAHITFIGEFNIPKNLPHSSPKEGVDIGDWNWDIFNDEVSVFVNPETGYSSLRLSSNHGVTDIWEWMEHDDYYRVPDRCRADFDGARRALNAVVGINFPACDVIHIESTIGHFKTLEDYDYARGIILPLMWAVERFLEVPHENVVRKSAKVEQASTWLANLETALRSVIDMDDPCRNPIHPDGTKGYLV